MMHPQVAPEHRYRAENHRQPRSSELAATCDMAPPSDSEPCITQRQPVAELQPLEEWATKAGTSSSESDDQAATTVAEARHDIEAEKKNDCRAADDAARGGCFGLDPARQPPAAAAESARERLKRHRTEMAGRVRIPDTWGQERLLKDWVDCAVFDRPLAATAGLLNARAALVAECAAARRTAHGSAGRPLRVQNGCS